MKNNEKYAFAWIVGWFVVLSPLFYAINGSFAIGLLNSIYGVLGAIMLLKYGEKL